MAEQDRKPLLFLPFRLILTDVQVIPKKLIGISKQTHTREMTATKKILGREIKTPLENRLCLIKATVLISTEKLS